MNATQAQANAPLQESVLRRAASGSMAEAIGAIAAIVLAIVGLAGVLSNVMAAIATIVVGAGILMAGGLGSSYRQFFAQGEGELLETSGGVTAEFLGGLAGIVLGILALFGTATETLLAVAVLVFGATLLLSHASLRGLAGEVAPVSSGGQVLVGLGAVVLGILAIIGQAPLTLILVALLSLGAAALFSGSAQASRMIAITRQ